MLKYFRLNQVKDNPFRPIIVSSIIITILLYGYFTQNFVRSSMMSMGLYTLFYYKNYSLRVLIKRLLIIGFSLQLAFILGVISSQNPFFAPFVVSAVAFASRFLTRLYGLTKPGSLFFVMQVSMGASLDFTIEKIPFIFLFFTIGIVASVLGGIIIKLLDNRPVVTLTSESLKERFYKHPLIILDSIFYSGALFLTVYISHGLQMERPYWLTVGCASILQAESLEAMRERHIQYIVGAMLGLSLAGLLLSIDIAPLLLIFLISILYGLSIFFVAKNYGIANIFINPMVLLLSSLMRGEQNIFLIHHRFIGIFVGSFMGFCVAWLMNFALDHYLRIIIDSEEEKIVKKEKNK